MFSRVYFRCLSRAYASGVLYRVFMYIIRFDGVVVFEHYRRNIIFESETERMKTEKKKITASIYGGGGGGGRIELTSVATHPLGR